MPNDLARRTYLKLTPCQAEYLKALYQLGAGGEAIHTSTLAARLGVSPPSSHRNRKSSAFPNRSPKNPPAAI